MNSCILIRLYIDILASPYSLSQNRSQSPVENAFFEGERLRRHRLTAKGFAKGFAKGLAKGCMAAAGATLVYLYIN